ncbi:MAG: hypothetical protein LBU22_13025 [Dysgonamonadaceae bacterium]|jgi:hypothetical protein|nr:hypothetical protein [Dysgonamonadaceae bacterium]
MKLLYIPLLFLCLQGLSGNLPAQTAEKPLPRYGFSIEPLYLYNGGLRINAEKRLTEKEWFELNITPYYLPLAEYDYDYGAWYTINSGFEYFSKLQGIGVGGSYKYYFSPLFFINPGVSYTFYKVKYSDTDFYPYQEDGLTYYSFERRQLSQIFNKFNLSFYIGGRTPFKRSFFVEYFVGAGQSFSSYKSGKKTFDDTMFGFGYTGLYLTTGVKLGFNIR